jgi:hypothetical protein
MAFELWDCQGRTVRGRGKPFRPCNHAQSKNVFWTRDRASRRLYVYPSTCGDHCATLLGAGGFRLNQAEGGLGAVSLEPGCAPFQWLNFIPSLWLSETLCFRPWLILASLLGSGIFGGDKQRQLTADSGGWQMFEAVPRGRCRMRQAAAGASGDSRRLSPLPAAGV